MASGDLLCWLPARAAVGPASSAATPDTRAGGATPAEAMPVLDFDGTSIEYADFIAILPANYDGGGLTLTFVWMATSATSGSVIWGAAVRALPDDTEDLDTTAHSYAFNDSAAAGAPSAAGEVGYDNVTFTDGADMDSWAAGAAAVIRVRRDPTNGSDDMSGDAELIGIIVKET